MAKQYPNPGVYTQEIPGLYIPVNHSITTVPVFVGFTEKTSYQNSSILYKPVRIETFAEFEAIFGSINEVNLEWDETTEKGTIYDQLTYRLYHALQLYFDNKGESCYVVSTGVYRKNIDYNLAFARFEKALQSIEKHSGPNVLVWADAHLCGEILSYKAYQLALRQGKTKKDWLVLIDLYSGSYSDKYEDLYDSFEQHIGDDYLKYGAAYYPYLVTMYDLLNDESKCKVKIKSKIFYLKLPPNSPDLSCSLYHFNSDLYKKIKKFFKDNRVVLPPSPAVAGVYCQKKVWEAPANTALQSVEKPMVKIDDVVQEIMNVNPSGKSVNAIRSFTGKGVLVWGARTLRGNDNEWRYISTVRFCGAVERISSEIISYFLGSSNGMPLWNAIRIAIDSLLNGLWREGALAGTKSNDAFFCQVGLGITMTEQDVLDNKIIVEVGLAVLRPAEFLVLRIEGNV